MNMRVGPSIIAYDVNALRISSAMMIIRRQNHFF